jgi:hypothetical protein
MPPQRRIYNILDWYWLADDGRIYSSKQQAVIPASDPGYVAFLDGGPATVWPRDANGDQSDAALQQVFDMANIQQGGVAMSLSVHSAPPSKSKKK